MATFYRINTGFTDLNADALLTKANKVFTAMTGAATTFPTPSPALTVLSGDIDNLQGAINAYNAANGGGNLLNDRNDAMPPLITTLIELATYVQTIAKGNKTIIELAGYDAEKDKTTVGELPAPTDFNVDSQRGGKIALSWKKVVGANSYVAGWTPAPATDASVWTTATSTKKKMGLSGFAPGLNLAFRVRAVGANLAENWSVIITDYTR